MGLCLGALEIDIFEGFSLLNENMFQFIKRKLNKQRIKNTFTEYGYEVESYELEGLGKVDFARWLHPLVSRPELSDSNLNFYRRLLAPGDMAVDIGAYIGDTTVPMALVAGSQGVVIGLEPNPYTFKVLEKNASLNPDLINIVSLPYAATAEEGEFIFHYSDASYGNGGFLSQIKNKKHHHRFELKVQGIKLEDYLRANYAEQLNRLSLVKVDAEGYDKEILKTITPLLEEFKPNLMVECYKRLNKTEREDLFDTITGMGYELFYLENFEEDGDKRQISRDDMMNHRHFEMLAIHPDR